MVPGSVRRVETHNDLVATANELVRRSIEKRLPSFPHRRELCAAGFPRGGNDVGLIVGRFPTVARPIFVCGAKPVSFTWPSLKGRETKEELPQGANGPTVCRSQGVSGKVSHTKLPSLWPSSTMTKPQTQPSGWAM